MNQTSFMEIGYMSRDKSINYRFAGFVSVLAVTVIVLAVTPRLTSSTVTVDVEWSQTYGGTGWDYATSLVQAADGGFALAGSTASFGAGHEDSWLVKTDSNETMEWNQTYGGTGQDHASSLVQTADGGFALAGSTDSFVAGFYDFWLVKTDSSGAMEWNQTYGGTGQDYARALVQTACRSFALAGSTKSFGAGDYDFWLVKTKCIDETTTTTITTTIVPPVSSFTAISLFTVVIIAACIKKVRYKKRE